MGFSKMQLPFAYCLANIVGQLLHLSTKRKTLWKRLRKADSAEFLGIEFGNVFHESEPWVIFSSPAKYPHSERSLSLYKFSGVPLKSTFILKKPVLRRELGWLFH